MVNYVDQRYKDILRNDLHRELTMRGLSVDIDELYTYSIKELEFRLNKLVNW